MDRDAFRRDLTEVINKHSAENGSNTPDWMLAEYLLTCLESFNSAVASRDSWYGVQLQPGVVYKVEQ